MNEQKQEAVNPLADAEFSMGRIKMFSLWNETDQVFAAPDDFETEEEALSYAEAFRKRFAAQGFYLTADGDRISPDDVELVVVPGE